MYFLRMSNLQLFVSSKNSKPIQAVSSLKPTLEISCGCQSDMKEHKQGETCHVPSSSSLSSCSSVSVESGFKEIKREEDVKEAASKVGDDDGYHTPTSPTHRIPASINCPPAPKKPSSRRYKKRKAAERDEACHRIDVREVDLIFWAEIDDRCVGQRSKKARGEASIDK